MKEYTNSQIAAVIDEYIHDEKHRYILKRRYCDHITYERLDEYIHDEKHRYILKRRYCDHITYERLAEEVQMDDSTVKRIVRKHEWTVFKHL